MIFPVADEARTGVVAKGITKIARVGDIPQDNIGVFVRLQCADIFVHAERRGGVAGHAGKGFFGRHAEQGAGHV